MHEIHFVADPVIGESSLPHFSPSANDSAEFMGISAFDQLNRPLDGHVQGGSQQEMYMLGHQDKRMQLISAFAAMPVERLQENADVRFDDEQPPALPRRERHEISSGRRDESSRLQGETSAAGSRTSSSTLNWHEWNSCPSRLFSYEGFSFRENEGWISRTQDTLAHASNREGHEFIRADDGGPGFAALAAGLGSMPESETSAAGSRTSSSTLNWHEWNSCPSRLFSYEGFSFRENGRPTRMNRSSSPNRWTFR